MKHTTTNLTRAFVAVLLFVTFGPVNAQQEALTRTDAMIPMRDGVRLNTHVYIPSRTEKLPILLLRTPYGIGDLSSAQLAAALPELTTDGYIIVQQDIRGRFKSEGQFVMLRQPRDPKDKTAIDESTDTYDTIEWLLKNVPNNNGRAGIAGTSYGAWLSVMAMLDPHPALKAVVEQASPADMWIGDDFHHNGAFRLSYGFEYAYMMESSKEMSDVSKVIDAPDTYDWYLPDQYIEVTGVPNGYYILETTVDPDNSLRESDETNNCGSVLIRLSRMGTASPKAELIRNGPPCHR